MNEIVINGIELRFLTNRMTGDKPISHVVFCRPIEEERPDAISCVANIGGMTSCTAVAKYLGVRSSCLGNAVLRCNEEQRVGLLEPCWRGVKDRDLSNTPTLILTPRPPDYEAFDEGRAADLMTEVLAVCARHRFQTLRMTQFCLLMPPRPLHHLRGVRRAIEQASQAEYPCRIYFDLDEFRTEELYRVFVGEP